MTKPGNSPVALITGAAVRIGAASARLLHNNGYNIVIHCNQSISDANLLAKTLNAQRNYSACVLMC
jgi:pteridine reductase